MRRKIWCWQRSIAPGQEDIWIGRIGSVGCTSWAFTERPERARVGLEAYVESRASASALTRKFGGKMRALDVREWIKARPIKPTRIGRRLEIVHEKTRTSAKPAVPRLYIPHGLAFGSGEHATTRMLLEALACRDDWDKASVFDLGTGSGVLALAARLFGARKIVATDFDPEAVRTARQNEALNFSAPLIRWACDDVRRLRSTARYDLVLANLFSGILSKAVSRIAGCVSPGGQLWQSGVLKSQQEEVIASYCAQRLQLVRVIRRGKWVMLQWKKQGQVVKPS